jgi:hypothetical protein
MSSATKYRSYGARLLIIGDALDPEQVSRQTGLIPTRVARRGDRIERPLATLTEKQGRWEVKSRLPPERPLAEHIDDVLSIVGPASAAIASVTPEFEVLLSCVVYAETVPELGLSSQQVRTIANLGAAVDIDLILVGDDAVVSGS